MRTRPGLGMELHRPCAELRIREALDGAVVERLVRRRAVLGRHDGEAVVLACHENAARLPFEHGMVGTAVAERQLERRETGREREQLVTEADAEDGDAAEQLADRRDLVGERLGIAGPVREQDAVEPGERAGVDVVRKDGGAHAGLHELPDDRALDAVVDDGDVQAPLPHLVLHIGRDAPCEGLSAHRWLFAHGAQHLVHVGVARHERRAHRTPFT